MNTQPEALLCAEMLEVARDNPTWADYSEIPKEACRRSAAELRRLHHNNQVLTDALWKACGDDEGVVNDTIASGGELK